MNRQEARQIADTITNEQINTMLEKAKAEIKDWTARSIVNKSFSKGTAWNLLGKEFDINHKYHVLGKANIIREFGEFLPEELKPKKTRKTLPEILHQDPIF